MRRRLWRIHDVLPAAIWLPAISGSADLKLNRALTKLGRNRVRLCVCSERHASCTFLTRCLRIFIALTNASPVFEARIVTATWRLEAAAQYSSVSRILSTHGVSTVTCHDCTVVYDGPACFPHQNRVVDNRKSPGTRRRNSESPPETVNLGKTGECESGAS
jgi:hypothetical protein